MSKDLILVAAIGAAVLLVIQKQAKARTTSAPAQVAGKPAPITANVNGDMWTRLMGEGWRSLVGAASGSGQTFVKNVFGQVTTGDGKPIGSGDPIADFSNVVAGVSMLAPTPYTDMLYPLEDVYDGALLKWEF